MNVMRGTIDRGSTDTWTVAKAPAAPVAATIDLRGIWDVLRRRWLSIVAIMLGFAVVAAIISLLLPVRYIATARILIDPYGLQIVQNDLTSKPSQSENLLADVESQLQVITSDTVLSKVVAREHLADDAEFGKAPPSLLADALALIIGSQGVPQDPAEKALRILRTRVQVQRPEKTFVINLSVSSRNPQRAAQIANAIASVYLEDQTQARSQAAGRAEQALTGRLNELREHARQSDAAVEEYKARNKIIGASGELLSEQQLSQLNAQLSAARQRTTEQRARYDEIERLRAKHAEPDSFGEVTESKPFSDLRARYAAAKQAEANAVMELGPRHPALRNMVAQTSQVRRLIDDEVTRMGRTALSDLNRAEANQKKVERQFETAKQGALVTNESLVKLRDLEREAESNRAIYAAFLNRAKEINEQRAIDTTNSRVISAASPPLEKSGPPRTLIVAGSLIFGLIGGIGFALLREQFDPMIRSVAQVVNDLGIPVLATVPKMLRAGGKSPQPGLLDVPMFPAGSDAFKAMIKLRDTLPSGGRGTRSIMVTALGEQSPHAIFALNLALVAAAGGESVFVIDGFKRQLVLRKYGVVDGGAGAADGATDGSVVRLQNNLTCTTLSSGGATSDDGDLVARAHGLHQSIIDKVGKFDLIVIDFVPRFSDRALRPIIPDVDDVLFVATAGQTRKEDLRRAVDAVNAVKAVVRGVILVGVREEADG
jgi:polysaccharide biosynthesis transport protein